MASFVIDDDYVPDYDDCYDDDYDDCYDDDDDDHYDDDDDDDDHCDDDDDDDDHHDDDNDDHHDDDDDDHHDDDDDDGHHDDEMDVIDKYVETYKKPNSDKKIRLRKCCFGNCKTQIRTNYSMTIACKKHRCTYIKKYQERPCPFVKKTSFKYCVSHTNYKASKYFFKLNKKLVQKYLNKLIDE